MRKIWKGSSIPVCSTRNLFDNFLVHVIHFYFKRLGFSFFLCWLYLARLYLLGTSSLFSSHIQLYRVYLPSLFCLSVWFCPSISVPLHFRLSSLGRIYSIYGSAVFFIPYFITNALWSTLATLLCLSVYSFCARFSHPVGETKLLKAFMNWIELNYYYY